MIIACVVCSMSRSTHLKRRSSLMVERVANPQVDQSDSPRMAHSDTLLEVNDLRMYFPIKSGFFSKVAGYVKAVDGVTFNIKRGETLGLVGESGCGKSTIGRCIVRAYNITGGSMLYRHENGNIDDLAKLEGDSLRQLRKEIRMVFQDPYSSLNPRMTLFDNV